MCHKKCQFFDEKCEILRFPEIDPKSIFTSKIAVFLLKSDVFQINSSHGAKHSPSPLPLARPSADSGGSRADA